MQTSLALLQHESVGAGADNANSFTRVFHPGHLDDLGTVVLGLRLLDQVGISKLVLGESVDVSNRLAAGRLGDELDLVPLDVFDDHDLELGKEMQGELVHGISKDGFLNQEDIAAGLLDLFAES